MERPACCTDWAAYVRDNPRPTIEHSPVRASWVIIDKAGFDVAYNVKFCPWCGTNLYKSPETPTIDFNADEEWTQTKTELVDDSGTTRIWNFTFSLPEKLYGQNRPDDSDDDPDHHDEDDLATRYFGDFRL